MMSESEKKSILLVDDEEDIREVLGISLTDIGYNVLTAENGEQALKIFYERQPPIVLTDIKMPGMDGIELLRKIKQENPDTEVVMITGHGDMDLAISSFKDEATDFITKPINIDSLEVALIRVHEKIAIRQKLREYTQNLENLVYEKSSRIKNMEKSAAGELPGGFQRDQLNTQQHFQELYDNLPCYIAVRDPSYMFTSTNRLFAEDFGDAIGMRCYAVLRQSQVPCSDCPAEKTFRDGQSYQTEMEWNTRNGEAIKVLVWTAPVTNAAGDVSRVLMMSTDMRQILRLQDQLSSLGLLIGSISHGIKGLLTGLDGGLYLLDSGLSKEDSDQIREGLDVVKMMAARIKKMVLDILLYAKERDLKRERVDLRSFAEDVAATVKPKIINEGIDFDCRYSQNLGEIDIDTGFMHSALINILENAIDACKEDTAPKDHRIVLEVYSDSKHAVFVITDNGIGMDIETSRKMFDLFFSSKDKKGTGLGLFISHRIVQQHGGDIQAESKPGKGSCLRVTLPQNLS